MGHGFRFSLDERYIIDKSQYHACQSETPFPECLKEAWCDGWGRFCCMLWDIFNIDRDYCDSERRKQKKLDDFIPKIVATGKVPGSILYIDEELKNTGKASIVISSPILQVNVLDYLGEKSKQEKKQQQKVRKMRGYYSKSKGGSKNPKLMKYKR